MSLVNESKARTHFDIARGHRVEATRIYLMIDEGGENIDRAALLIEAMEALSEATRNETYVRMLQDPNDPMWRCIAREKAEAGTPKPSLPLKPCTFNHQQFHKGVRLAQLAREHEKRDKLKPMPRRLFQ